MIRTGEVVDRSGETVSVVFERPEACAQCNGCVHKHCTRVDLTADAGVGDTVDVEMPGERIVKASAIAYILPLLLLLLGLIAGTLLQPYIAPSASQDLVAVLFGGVLLAAGLYAVHRIDMRLRNREDWQPRVLKVHKKET